MAGKTPASAALFMRRCRQNSLLPRNLYRAASTSPYAPSNFSKKYTSPIASPSPQAQLPSNLEGPRTASPAHEAQRLSLPNFLDRKSSKSPAWARPKARPTAIGPAHSKTSFWNYLRRSLGLKIHKREAEPDPFNVWNNPYRAHKTWPPKLLELNHKQQLHFEKTYRRRVNLKWARPVFKKWVTLLQNGIIAFIIFWAVFMYDQEGGTPFDGLRAWVWTKMGDSDLLPERVRDNANQKVEDYNKKWGAIKDTFFEITPVPGQYRTAPVDPEEEKIPWAQRKRSDT